MARAKKTGAVPWRGWWYRCRGGSGPPRPTRRRGRPRGPGTRRWRRISWLFDFVRDFISADHHASTLWYTRRGRGILTVWLSLHPCFRFRSLGGPSLLAGSSYEPIPSISLHPVDPQDGLSDGSFAKVADSPQACILVDTSPAMIVASFSARNGQIITL